MENIPMTRRGILGGACAVGGASCLYGSGRAFAGEADPELTDPPAVSAPSPDLIRAALTEWAARGAVVRRPEMLGLVDFGIPSYQPRFFLIRPATQAIVGAFLVAHGIGSDPGPTPSPWPKVFSNAVNSEASCIGGFVTTHVYEGRHGLSLRIRGLDPTDDNAEQRDVVIHSAPYVDAERARRGLPIERSQGCFAVTGADRDTIIAALRDGAFLFAGSRAV